MEINKKTQHTNNTFCEKQKELFFANARGVILNLNIELLKTEL